MSQKKNPAASRVRNAFDRLPANIPENTPTTLAAQRLLNRFSISAALAAVIAAHAGLGPSEVRHGQ